MGYILGQCPQCNNVMSMPDDSAIVRCPTCQAEVSAAEASAIAGAAQRASNPYAGAVGASSTPAPPIGAGAPLLNTWKTNVLFTVLGILAGIVINLFAQNSIDANGNPTPYASMVAIFSLAFVAFAIVYAAKIYPSYFSERPMISSNEAISFLNGLVGGIIWGLLWNHNLTLQNKGVSHIVYIALIAAAFVLSIAAAFMGAALIVASAA